jgi:hypothetical protein
LTVELTVVGVRKQNLEESLFGFFASAHCANVSVGGSFVCSSLGT